LGWNEAPIALLMEVSTGRLSSNNKQRSSNCILKLQSFWSHLSSAVVPQCLNGFSTTTKPSF
jgi:hypothetical protein